MNKRSPLFINSGWNTPNYSSIPNNDSINKLYDQPHLHKNPNKSLLFTIRNKNNFHKKNLKRDSIYKQTKKTSSSSAIISNYSNTKTKNDSSNLSPKNSFKRNYIIKNNSNCYNNENNKFILSSPRNNDNNYVKIMNKFSKLDLGKVVGSPHPIYNNKNNYNSEKRNNFLGDIDFSNLVCSKNNYKTFYKLNSLDVKNKNVKNKNKNFKNDYYTISPRIEFQCYSEQNESNTRNKNIKINFSSISPQVRLSYLSKNKINEVKNNIEIQRTLSGTIYKEEINSKRNLNNYNINKYNNIENKENIQINRNNFSENKIDSSYLDNMDEPKSLFEKCVKSLNFNYNDDHYNYNYKHLYAIPNLNKNSSPIAINIDNNVNKVIANNKINMNSQFQNKKDNKRISINKANKAKIIKNKIINFNTEYPIKSNHIVKKSKSCGVITQKIKFNKNDSDDIQLNEEININEEIKKNDEYNFNYNKKEKLDKIIKNILINKYKNDNKKTRIDKNTRQYLSNINNYIRKKYTKNIKNNNIADNIKSNTNKLNNSNTQNPASGYIKRFSYIMPPNNYFN